MRGATALNIGVLFCIFSRNWVTSNTGRGFCSAQKAKDFITQASQTKEFELLHSNPKQIRQGHLICSYFVHLSLEINFVIAIL